MKKLLQGIFLFIFFLHFPAFAQEGEIKKELVQSDSSISAFQFSYGIFDVLKQNKPVIEYRMTYYFNTEFLTAQPFAGGMLTHDFSSYIFFGFSKTITFFDVIALRPSLAAGLYLDTKGEKLHYPLEFRSQLELFYQTESGINFGLSFSHISNANLGKRNPGAESFMLTWSIPTNMILP